MSTIDTNAAHSGRRQPGHNPARRLPTVLCVFGTRPEAIKMAPVIWACRARADKVRTLVCCTGQHRELIEQVAGYLDLRIDLNLDAMQPGQSLAALFSRCLASLDQVMERYAPAGVVAQGDTATTLAAAVCAFLHRLPLVHVEAGLRTNDLAHPWPEEFNRRVVSMSTRLHCAPTHQAAEHLLAEGHDPETVFVTGNTVVDALQSTLRRERRQGTWIEKYQHLDGAPVALVTVHRRENHGQPLRRICRAIGGLARRFPAVRFVFPVHPNPQVHGPVRKALARIPNVLLVEPLAYPEFVWLLDRSRLIVTDSGGIQEEACVLNKHVLVLRDSTERPEAVESGWATLVGADEQRIIEHGAALLERNMANHDFAANSPFGDGFAGERIVGLMLEKLIEVEQCTSA